MIAVPVQALRIQLQGQAKQYQQPPKQLLRQEAAEANIYMLPGMYLIVSVVLFTILRISLAGRVAQELRPRLIRALANQWLLHHGTPTPEVSRLDRQSMVQHVSLQLLPLKLPVVIGALDQPRHQR